MKKRKIIGSGSGVAKKKVKLDHSKQDKSVAKTQSTQNTTTSHSSKQPNRNQDAGSTKVAKNFWWHSKKVTKLETDGNLSSERAKASKDESASKVEKSKGKKEEVRIGTKKALQLKKKRQRKNRLLSKKKNLGDASISDILRKPKTWGRLVSKSPVGAQGSSQNPSLQKSGGQKEHKKKGAKKFKKVRNAKEGVQEMGEKNDETPINSGSVVLASGQERSRNLKEGKSSRKNNGKKSMKKMVSGSNKMETGPSSKEVSSNWKALLPIVQKSKEAVTNRHGKYGKGGKPNEKPKPSKPDVWFDNIDPSLIRANENAESDDDNVDVQSETGYNPLIRKDAQDCLTKCLAMDCEMVGTGHKGSQSVLARVSVVNQYGACVFDKYITPREPVTDYRTFVSGIRPQDLRDKGEDFEKVQKELCDLLKGRVVVGHALHNDFKVLYFSHPRSLIRDTSTYQPFRELFKSKRPGLKKLTELVLKVKVQKGEHNSVEDAQAAMKLYMLHRRQWEKSFREKTHHRPSTKKPSKMLKKMASEAPA